MFRFLGLLKSGSKVLSSLRLGLLFPFFNFFDLDFTFFRDFLLSEELLFVLFEFSLDEFELLEFEELSESEESSLDSDESDKSDGLLSLLSFDFFFWYLG